MEYPVLLFVFVWCSFGLVAASENSVPAAGTGQDSITTSNQGLSNQPDTDSVPIVAIAAICGGASAAIVVGLAVFEVCINRREQRRKPEKPPKTPRENDYLKKHVNPAYVSYSGIDDHDAALVHHQQLTTTTARTNHTKNVGAGLDTTAVGDYEGADIPCTYWLFILMVVCPMYILVSLLNIWISVCLLALLSTCQAALLHKLTRSMYWEEHVNPAYVAYDGNDDDDDQDSALARHQRPTPTTATTNNTNNDDTHVDTGLDTSADRDYEDAGICWTEMLFCCVIACLVVLQAYYLLVLLDTCLAAWQNSMLYVLTDSGLAGWLADLLVGLLTYCPAICVDVWLHCILTNCLADLLDYWLTGYQARWLAVCLSRAALAHEIRDSGANTS